MSDLLTLRLVCIPHDTVAYLAKLDKIAKVDGLPGTVPYGPGTIVELVGWGR